MAGQQRRASRRASQKVPATEPLAGLVLPEDDNALYFHAVVAGSEGRPFELNCNPSSFSVYSAVRQLVLECKLRRSAIIYNQTVQGLNCDESSDENGDKNRDVEFLKVPKVVGLGLCVVFELIRESRINNPSLCARALHALLDSLQGQVPEGLKEEPPDVTEPLFEMLLDIASAPYPTTDADTSSQDSVIPLMKAFACSSLLSLVVALGDTGKMLTAVSVLLTSSSSHHEDDEIETPSILIAAQRSTHAVLLGKTTRPDWLTHGFPSTALCDSFPINLQLKIEEPSSKLYGERSNSSLAFDGRYLYLLLNNVLYKIGSGYGGTVKGQLILSRRLSTRSSGSAVGWLGCIKGYLYYQPNNWTKNELTKLDTETLRECGSVTLGISHWGPSVSASDGEYLIMLTASKDNDTFSLRTLKPSTCSPAMSNTAPASVASSSGSSGPCYLMPVVQELTLKLAHKCLTVCGGLGQSLFESQQQAPNENDQEGDQNNRLGFKTISGCEEESAQIGAGRDFAILRTQTGKVLYTGKCQSLGMKHGAGAGRWSELQISKSPKIVNMAVGHEGAHILLVTDDGVAYFCGLAKRGEDGDQSKSRRQPKASKPKRMIKMDSRPIVSCACNHGTSALVTRSGELYMFGKDNAHVDKNTGLVTGLRGAHVTQVALGKAHTVALTDKGQVYTFGFNHKGQCGQDFAHSSATSSAYAIGSLEAAGKPVDEVLDSQVDITEDVVEPSCSYGNHKWKQDVCMICTSCGECTGYSSACVASGKSEVRNPGMPCGCGAGDAGCADCGICKNCDRLVRDANDAAAVVDEGIQAIQGAAAPLAIANPPYAPFYGIANDEFDYRAERQIYQGNDPLQRAIEQMVAIQPAAGNRRRAWDAHVGRKIRHLNHRHRGEYAAKGPGAAAGNGQLLESVVERLSASAALDEQGAGSDCEATKLTPLPPTKLNISTRIVQVACGLHHTVLLNENGEVFTFGSNNQGQLGLGDFGHRDKPTKVPVHSQIVQIAAGSNHTVLLSNMGQVFTFGSNQKGQLGRLPSAIDYAWNAYPYAISNIGPQSGRRATWIEASGDYTFVKLDESLINPLTLHSAKVVANSRCIVIAPPNDLATGASSDQGLEDRSFRSLVINRIEGTCRTFTHLEQVNLGSFNSLCLDSTYDILWTYDADSQIINRYNVIASEAKSVYQMQPAGYLRLPTILSPEVALPCKQGIMISRSNAAFNVLCILHTLTTANSLGFTVQDDEQSKGSVAKSYSKDDFSSVNRFESHGGGWGYSGHSIEAIRFMADTDILLGGFGLFGGRGEYMAKLRIYDIGPDGGEQEGDGELLAETDETPYECGARQKYSVLFEEPIPLQANRWYVAWARVSGPSSDCGSSGQCVVNTEDQINFYFKSSKKSNNGTDVNAGQIPLILYKLGTSGFENGCSSNNGQADENAENSVAILSRDFSMTVTAECFNSLIKLLRWAWSSFKANIVEFTSTGQHVLEQIVIELRHLTYVCCATLHLLKTFVNEVFPNSKKRAFTGCDILRLAECVADTRTLVKTILLEGDKVNPGSLNGNSQASECEKIAVLLFKQILNECQTAFVSCYHAFYPSTALRWRGLCDLLLPIGTVEFDGIKRTDNLLAAMLAALCSPLIRLTLTFPLNQSLEIQSITSPSDLTSPTGPCPVALNDDTNIMQDQVLVDKMLEKSNREGCHTGLECSFRDVLIKLLSIVGQPIECILYKHRRSIEAPSANSSLDEDEPFYRDLYENPPSKKLVENTCTLLSSVISELVAQATGIGLDIQTPTGQTQYTTPTRFSRVSQNRTWNTGNGSPDAICFSVDRPGIMIAGATVYGGLGNQWHYELELLDYQGTGKGIDQALQADQRGQQWSTIDMIRGTYRLDEKNPDTAEIKFERPVPIRENVKYALRLKNHGARTNNGDGGLTHVRGPDGTTFTFTDCSLSLNGTNHTRGQIPQLIYFSSPPTSKSAFCHSNHADEIQSRLNVLSISDAVVALAEELFVQAQNLPHRDAIASLSSSLLVTNLLPAVLASLAPIATSDPKSATQILSMIKKMLPLVALLVKKLDPSNSNTSSPPPSPSARNTATTSKHYVLVESDHPYKPASVSNYKVSFPASVKWLSLEFDSRCGTAQPEDALQLLIPSLRRVQAQSTQRISTRKTSIKEGIELNNGEYWPVFKKLTGKPAAPNSCWPTNCLILPGSEVVFSLETASDYVKDEKACYYGFRCQIVGYESPCDSSDGLVVLEQELTYLGATCVNALLARELQLPPLLEESTIDEAEVAREFANHMQVLSRGLALGQIPTASEALDGVLALSHEKPFLKDFVNCTPGTSGGRLARWLQPESYADPNLCEIACTSSSGQSMQCGWPSVITVTIKDQYGQVVNVPGLRVEVCAQPFHTNTSATSATTEGRSAKLSKLDEKKESACFGGLPPPQTIPYSVTMKDKMLYHAITMMPAYEKYSFEELRFVAPVKKRSIEAMLVRPNSDGTYTASWTPGCAGWYQVKVLIDGVPITASQSIQVGEAPKGISLPPATAKSTSPLLPKKGRQRKFVGRTSSGLRIRALPSLQSEQIGLIAPGATVTVYEELQNDDGIWVRLAPNSIGKYCHIYNEPNYHLSVSSNFIEAWCLQYNHHLNRHLLVPISDESVAEALPAKTTSNIMTDSFSEHLPTKGISKRQPPLRNGSLPYPAIYHVVKTGNSGHNIRSKPNLRSASIGMLVLGNSVTVMQEVKNLEGIWLKLSEDSKKKFCFNIDGDAWTLASTDSDLVYLQNETELMQLMDANESEERALAIASKNRLESTPFESLENIPNPRLDIARPPRHDCDPIMQKEQSSSRLVGINSQSFGAEASNMTLSQSIPSESEFYSISSSYDAGATNSNTMAEQEKTETESIASVSSAGGIVAASKKKIVEMAAGVSAVAAEKKKELTSISVNVKEMVRSFSRESSPTPPSKTSPNAKIQRAHSLQQKRPSLQSATSVQPIKSLVKDLTRRRTSSASDTAVASQSAELEPSKRDEANQTSPPGEKLSASANVPKTKELPTVDSNEQQASPQPSSSLKRAKSARSKRERPSSPTIAPAPFTNSQPSSSKASLPLPKPPVKEAMSNSIAECLRAVFSAFIWHEGILHDAMAAASYLKFSNDLTKEAVYKKFNTTVQSKPSAQLASKEQKAKYRHSVEVSQLRAMQMSESYANANIDVKPITENEIAQPKNSDTENENDIQAKFEKHFSEEQISQPLDNEQPSTSASVHVGTVIVPETIMHLLYLWDQVSKFCFLALSQPVIYNSANTPAADSPATTPVQMFSRMALSSTKQPVVPQNSIEVAAASPIQEKQINNYIPNPNVAFPHENFYANFRGLMRQRNLLPRFRGLGRAHMQPVNMFGEAALLANGMAPQAAAPEPRERERMAECELCGEQHPYPVTRHMRRAHPGCGEHAGGKGYNSSGSFCGGWAGHCGDGGMNSSNWYLICDVCRHKYLKAKRTRQGQKDDLRFGQMKSCLPASPKMNSPSTPLEAHQIMKENAMFLLRLASFSDPASSLGSSKTRMVHEFACSNTSFECLEGLGVQRNLYKQRLAELENLTEDEIRAIQTDRPANQEETVTRERRTEDKTVSNSNQVATSSKTEFQRSVSIGLSEQRERVVMTPRKRATSTDSSSPLVCQPSTALLRLVDMAEQVSIVDMQSLAALAPAYVSRQSSQESGNSRPPSQLQRQSSFPSVLSKRPILLFVNQQHDLVMLTAAIKNAIRKVACRAYALQALTWLMRNVTQPIGLHDLMWSFVSSLSVRHEQHEKIDPQEPPQEQAPPLPDNKRNEDHEPTYHSQGGICVHPSSDLSVAGDALRPLQEAFHSFLQTVSDIMPLLPMASPLQQIAIRCFCLHFGTADHAFLHRGHVFSNISKILSRTDEDQDECSGGPCSPQRQGPQAQVEVLCDVTAQTELKASSRQAMIASLTDNSTETFWESGDEDRTKTKVITISAAALNVPLRIIYIHIDNCRDLGSKISLVCFKASESMSDASIKIKSVDVDSRFAGWLSCLLPSPKVKLIKIEMKGPDNTLRLRQVKILAVDPAKKDQKRPSANYSQIQQLNCETETLRVFRLLTSQVFGKLILNEQSEFESGKFDLSGSQTEPEAIAGTADSNDLREHMVGILFSRSSKLSHLQKQVCAHIVQAIRVEALRLREEWEALLCSNSASMAPQSTEIPSDAYCFEMLSMVLALSGSSIGRLYLAQQNDLLLDLFGLLHTGSARVQRQVTSLLRRVLPEIEPASLARLLNVKSLPPSDYLAVNNKEVEFDIQDSALLDVFLACIAKALTVQSKVKGSFGGPSSKNITTVTLATAIHPRDSLGDRWWLRGCMSRKLAEVIITLLKDMAAGKLTETWASVTKNAIAENILNLTRLSDQYRSPQECIKTPTLWLGLASLCVLDQEHAERLSSSHWVASAAGDQANGNQPQQPARPFCDNHDDQETLAMILCSVCGNLCADCDRFLHLHRKTKGHQRQIFKEEEEAIKVDLHEGCGRTKLFWLMALADSKTLKAMVEFRGESGRSKTVSLIQSGSIQSAATGICRFCGSSGNTGLLAIDNVCSEPDCQEYSKTACQKTLPCGHMCGGVRDESACLPCLHGCTSSELKQDADDMCMICFTEAISYAPAIQLKCGHLFHLHCCTAVLRRKWPGPRITFGFSLCPICKTQIEHPALEEFLQPIRVLYEDVKRKALMRLEYEGLHRSEAITKATGGRFYQDPAGFAMERYAYYVCCKCEKAYYGGEARCDVEAGLGEDYDPNELVCGGCSDISRAQMCPKHGTDFLEYKCRYCCSVAVFFCFGTTHFCNACHDDFQRVTNIPKAELPHCPAGARAKQLEGDECPLHVKHPPTGEEFALGCGVCRNAHTF